MIVRLYDAKRIVGSTGLAFNVEGHIDIVTDEQYTESVIISQENHRLDVEWTNRADDHDRDKILSFLKVLKESDFFIEYIYTRGGCYQLYKVLKSLWPSAQPYLGVHMAHVITKIGDCYFDINGEVKIDGDFLPMTDEEEREVATWSFAENNELYLGHCPVCDEPITIDRNNLIKTKED